MKQTFDFNKIIDLKLSNNDINKLNWLIQDWNPEDFVFGLFNIACDKGFFSIADANSLSVEELRTLLAPHSRNPLVIMLKIIKKFGISIQLS